MEIYASGTATAHKALGTPDTALGYVVATRIEYANSNTERDTHTKSTTIPGLYHERIINHRAPEFHEEHTSHLQQRYNKHEKDLIIYQDKGCLRACGSVPAISHAYGAEITHGNGNALPVSHAIHALLKLRPTSRKRRHSREQCVLPQ